LAKLSEDKPLLVVQLSDCHLGAGDGSRLLGMDTDLSLNAVVAQLRAERPHIDLLVCSGDLAADGEPSAYQRFWPMVASLADRVICLPGNHDDPTAMRQVIGEASMPFATNLGDWQILLFDSSVPGEVGGTLSETQLQAFASQRDASRPGLIFMHHHLLPLGCQWLDAQRVSNAERFFDLLEGAGGVEAIVSGHVHQEWRSSHRGQCLLTTPSTCIQFAPKSEGFAVDDLNPGYRWLELYPDGHLETGVSRVTGVSFYVDHDANGYQ
jgi:3',5'-cyclic-AMP phosphodiesterase